jgi:hypothetical protein
MKFCSNFWTWIRWFCRMCNFRSATMTQKCHERVWKFAVKELHTEASGMQVKERALAGSQRTVTLTI